MNTTIIKTFMIGAITAYGMLGGAANYSKNIQNVTEKYVQQTKTVNKTTKEQKTQAPKKEEVKTYTNTITFNGTSLQIGEFTYSSIYNEASLRATQNYIDQGYIAKGFHELNVNDGYTSWVGGHNPGVMAPMAAYAEVGKEIVVWDEYGNHRTYRFDRDEMLPLGVRSDYRMIDLLDNQIHQREGIIVQFCTPETNMRHFWVAYPVD